MILRNDVISLPWRPDAGSLKTEGTDILIQLISIRIEEEPPLRKLQRLKTLASLSHLGHLQNASV